MATATVDADKTEKKTADSHTRVNSPMLISNYVLNHCVLGPESACRCRERCEPSIFKRTAPQNSGRW